MLTKFTMTDMDKLGIKYELGENIDSGEKSEACKSTVVTELMDRSHRYLAIAPITKEASASAIYFQLNGAVPGPSLRLAPEIEFSPFDLFDDSTRDFSILIDLSLLGKKKLTFKLDNKTSIGISFDDLKKWIEFKGNEFRFVSFTKMA